MVTGKNKLDNLDRLILKSVSGKDEISMSSIRGHIESIKPNVSESDIGFCVWELVGYGVLNLSSNLYFMKGKRAKKAELYLPKIKNYREICEMVLESFDKPRVAIDDVLDFVRQNKPNKYNDSMISSRAHHLVSEGLIGYTPDRKFMRVD